VELGIDPSNAGSAASYGTGSSLAPESALPPGAPTLTGEPPAAAQRSFPGYRLFDMTSIGLTTFIGSPIAGTALMAANYRRLGQPRQATIALASGIVGTAAAMALGTLYAPRTASSVGAVVLFTITYQTIKAIQGPAIERHLNQGGERSSRWVAFGISLVVAAALVAVVFGGALAYFVGSAVVHDKQSAVVIGTKDNILISGSATKQDALNLGEALKRSGYFKDKGVTVLLDKAADGAAVSFVVHDGIWDRRDMVSAFEEIGREIAPSVGGFPIKVRLADSAKNTKKEVNVGKILIGNDEVFYYGSATEADANALGESLKANGYFGNGNVDVFLNKGEVPTNIAFVVSQGSWDNPRNVALFEALVRKAAPSIGGLPIKLQLDDDQLDIMKTETVN